MQRELAEKIKEKMKNIVFDGYIEFILDEPPTFPLDKPSSFWEPSNLSELTSQHKLVFVDCELESNSSSVEQRGDGSYDLLLSVVVQLQCPDDWDREQAVNATIKFLDRVDWIPPSLKDAIADSEWSLREITVEGDN